MTTKNVTYLVPPGSIRCYIDGTLRKDTPEENVRQRWARSLVEEYGYSKSDIVVEHVIHLGVAKKRVDIAVFKPGASKSGQDEIIIIVEAKREEVKLTDPNKGMYQLHSYMAACNSCKFGLWVGKERQAYEKLAVGAPVAVSDIPRAGEDRPRRPERADLEVSHDLASTFRRCHNYIHANGGLQKAEAFHEMLKLIFCKMHDEDNGTSVELDFAVDPKEQRSVSGRRRLLEERIQPLFKAVKEQFPYIFAPEERVKLEPHALAYIVAEMQFVSLTRSKTDVKGAAYEELVGQNLRGDRGEYFTPRNVCDMTVRMIQSMFRSKDLANVKVLDCCCGTGGFLVSWIDNLRRTIRTHEEAIRRPGDIEEHVRRRVHDACAKSLYGLDINPFLVRTAQMNMVMHGDGATNIFRADSIRSPGEWDEEVRSKLPYGKMDVVLTNPPFGNEVRIDDAHVLSRYELSSWEAQNSRASMPAEQIFVETAMRCLREGGILGIVLPDGILNNPGLRFLRSWLLNRGRIIASVDLPKETFARTGGVNNPSVLIIQKFTREQAQQVSAGLLEHKQMVFMATPRTAGIDKRGKPIFLRHADGRITVDADGNQFLDDEIASVADQFTGWISSSAGNISA